MKKNAVCTAAAHAAYDKGGAETSPSNPTRVGNFNNVVLYALFSCLSMFLVGCAGGPPIAIRGPYGTGVTFGGGSRPGGSMMHGGGAQAASLPVQTVMQIERECNGDPDAIMSRIQSMGYGVTVSRKPRGGFHYHWHAVGGGTFRPGPSSWAPREGCQPRGGYTPSGGNCGNQWWTQAPTYRPGCGIMRPEQGGSIWAQPRPWKYEYAPETWARHMQGGSPVFGR
jgi:hypothetical protein